MLFFWKSVKKLSVISFFGRENLYIFEKYNNVFLCCFKLCCVSYIFLYIGFLMKISFFILNMLSLKGLIELGEVILM